MPEGKTAILGDMLELGEKTAEEHTKVLNCLYHPDIEKVILVGPVFSKIARNSELLSFPDVNKLTDYLKCEPIKGKTILVKGSRGTGLERIYDLL